MEASDVISVVALVVSIIAFYWTALRGPKFRSPPIRYVQFAHPDDGSPLILLSVVVSNVGSRTGIIDYLYLVLEISSRAKQERNFWAYTEPADAEPRLVRPHTLGSLPSAFAIEPGESIKKLIYFVADDPDLLFDVGEYDLELKAVVAGKRKHLSLQRQAIRVIEPVEQGKFVIGGSLQKTDTIVMGPLQLPIELNPHGA